MNSLLNYTLSILLLLLAATALAGKNGGVHLADSKCQSCHLSASVDAKQARLLVASQEKLCAECHPKDVKMSHPSGFIPQRPLPDSFPLDWKGELTCTSCHQVHGEQPGLPRSLAKGAQLCLACHDEQFFDRLPEQKKGTAPLVHGKPLPAPPVSPANVVVLDELSLQCMECHDDKGGTAQNRVGLNTRGIMRHMTTSLSHPIGGSYAIVTQLGAYRPKESLSAKILLQEGKVGCVSCHEQYGSKQHGRLIATQYESICHDCHVK